MGIDRVVVRRALRRAPSRAHSVWIALEIVLEVMDEPERFAGPRRSERLLVCDLVEAIRGCGVARSRRIYRETGLDRRAPLADLDEATLDDLGSAVLHSLGRRSARELRRLVAATEQQPSGSS